MDSSHSIMPTFEGLMELCWSEQLMPDIYWVFLSAGWVKTSLFIHVKGRQPVGREELDTSHISSVSHFFYPSFPTALPLQAFGFLKNLPVVMPGLTTRKSDAEASVFHSYSTFCNLYSQFLKSTLASNQSSKVQDESRRGKSSVDPSASLQPVFITKEVATFRSRCWKRLPTLNRVYFNLPLPPTSAASLCHHSSRVTCLFFKSTGQSETRAPQWIVEEYPGFNC